MTICAKQSPFAGSFSKRIGPKRLIITPKNPDGGVGDRLKARVDCRERWFVHADPG